MAISHVQPLLLALTSLFFLPALFAVQFEYCNKSGYDFGSVSKVDISPNPIGVNDYELDIKVYGYASTSIKKGVIKVYAKSKDITDLLRQSDLCVVNDECAIKAGTNFLVPLSEVLKDVLEGDYKYAVEILEVGDAGEQVKMCVDFSLPTSANTLKSA